MSAHTQPAPLGASTAVDADYRVDHPGERLALLRELRDRNIPVHLSAPGGGSYTSSLWALDSAQQRLNFSADEGNPQLQSLIDANEAAAVAYLDSVKLQFDLQGLLLVRSPDTCTLQTQMPRDVFRFQRRDAFRVQPSDRYSPVARLRHPSLPDMTLALRVLDVSIGGCALLLPHDVPPLQPSTQLADVEIDLDVETRFVTTLRLHHISAIQQSEHGLRLGCEWGRLGGSAERALQRWIDQAQKRRRLLTPD